MTTATGQAISHSMGYATDYGGLALLLAGAAFLAMLLAGLLMRRTPLRPLVTMWVFALAAGRYLQARWRGDRRLAGPAALRWAFEKLGPTYIKFGQLIASSSGIFAERYVQEFQKCLDRVPPEPWPVVLETLTRSLEQPADKLFLSLSPTPLAAASIAQVYAARGLDAEGRECELVVKVQRRGLPELVEADIAMLSLAAEVLQRLPRLRNANPRGIVAEFDRTIHEELDFRREAAHMEEWNRMMAELGRRDVCAPRPLRSLSTPSVLTMERLHGARVDDLAGWRQRGFDATAAESKLIDGMHAWFQTLLHYGFFHGDVHAGNLMLLDDGRLGFLDFGIIGRLERTQRRLIADYLLAVATKDFVALAKTLSRMGVVNPKKSDEEWAAFAHDLKDAYSPFMVQSIEEIDYAAAIPKMIRVSARHGTRLPSEFVLITRQLLYFDRYARLIAPSLNLFADPRVLLTIGAEFAKL